MILRSLHHQGCRDYDWHVTRWRIILDGDPYLHEYRLSTRARWFVFPVLVGSTWQEVR